MPDQNPSAMQVPDNPFAVFTPEGLTAERVLAIFSTSMPGLDNLQLAGHTFVLGTRGSGKSILFRYLEPDCQMLVRKGNLSTLPYVAFYISFRESEAQITELHRFRERHGEVFFNEHLLVLSIATRITARLLKNGIAALAAPKAEVGDPDALHDAAAQLGILEPSNEAKRATDAGGVALLTYLSELLQYKYVETIQYVKRHAFRGDIIPYEGALFGFDDFLLPYIRVLRLVLGLGEDQQTFLLLDDADSLTYTQTTILNSWVARRLSTQCGLKVAAQLTAYKTHLTSLSSRIEAPHDYQEINISDISTNAEVLRYRSRIAIIIHQRLQSAGIHASAEKYFPEDHRQELEIRRIAEDMRGAWRRGHGRGYRDRDDVNRYARPEYIRRLGGNRKSRSKYSYSGFDQLVHISSGVPRFFLEAAAEMYGRAVAEPSGSPDKWRSISSGIQNDVVREQAQHQFIWDIRDLEKDVERLHGTPQRAVRLHNLLNGLGSVFERALISESASERKYFSFAFSDYPEPEVEEVLELGVRYGYLFRRIIGRKEGLGRTPLYMMSRRLSPLFNLDPMGVAAYKFFTNKAIRDLMDRPDAARRLLRSMKFEEQGQPTLPFGEDRSDG